MQPASDASPAGVATSGLRVVAPESPEAWCETNEILVSAICVGGATTSPVTTYPNGAKCGYGDSAARARIMCMPATASEQPGGTGQQGAIPEDSGAQAADAGASGSILRVVATGANVASCEPGETLASAFCTGGGGDYPLLAYPGGKVKCGYSGGLSKATAVCLPGADEAAASAVGEAGLRVVASDSNVAWCESGETMLGAYCTGIDGSALQTYANGAKCGYSTGNGKATVLCSAGVRANADPSADGLFRVASGKSQATCENDEKLVSAFCTGSWKRYPLLTYANAAKCGYSNGTSQVTAVCMKQ